MKVFCELLFAGVGGWVSHIDAPLGKLVMNRLTLIERTQQGHLTSIDRSDLVGRLDDPRVVTLGEDNPSAESRRPCFENFEKTHNPSPSDIVAYRR
jgi:hypothetical protein